MMQVFREKKFSPSYKLLSDVLGISTSVLCTIHCIILPLFASSLPVWGLHLMEDKGLEMATIFLSFIFGYASFYGFHRKRKKALPLTLFIIGFVFLAGNQLIEGIEEFFISIASTLIITAHTMKLYETWKNKNR